MLLPIACLAMSGCQSADSKIVGKWHTETTVDDAQGDQPGDRLLKGIAAMTKAVGPQIDFKADHRFTMIFFFTIEGAWTVDSKIVTCTPDRVSGLEMGKDKTSREPFRLKLSEDGTTLRAVDDSGPSWELRRGPAENK